MAFKAPVPQQHLEETCLVNKSMASSSVILFGAMMGSLEFGAISGKE
jgi:hypothetical protein